MKTKLITGAITGATLFGGALSVSAAGIENNVGTTDVGVNIINATGDDEALLLQAVPTNYIFESFVTENSSYSLTATQIGNGEGGNNKITVHKNYLAVGKKEVQATVSDLTLTRGVTDIRTVTVANFTINTKEVFGTGEVGTLYTDSDFAGAAGTTGEYSKDVTEATIEFGAADLQPNDKLTGTITYSVVDTPTTQPTP